MAHLFSVFREIAAPGVRPTAEADLHRAPAPAPPSHPDHGPARLGPTLRAAPAPTHAPGLQLHPPHTDICLLMCKYVYTTRGFSHCWLESKASICWTCFFVIFLSIFLTSVPLPTSLQVQEQIQVIP